MKDVLHNIRHSSSGFIKLSHEIKSKWQADFLQVFPMNYDKLPYEHSTDKDVFEEFYSADDLTFEEFRIKYYEQQGKNGKKS